MDAFFLFIRPYLIGSMLGLSAAWAISFAARPNYEVYEYDYPAPTAESVARGKAALDDMLDLRITFTDEELEAQREEMVREQQEWDAKLIQGMREIGIENPEEMLYQTRRSGP